MATVTAYKSIDMLNPTIWYGSVDTATTSMIILTNYSKIGLYIGSGFKYKNYAVTSGTLTGYGNYTYTYPNYFSDPDYTVTGLKLNAKIVYTYVQSGQATQLYTLALAGADTIYGSNSADFLRGFAGNDTIYGYDGIDTIYGDNGNDTLTGGSGADGFVFNLKPSPSNFDTITDFVSGTDGLILSSSIFTKLSGDSDLTDNFKISTQTIDSNDYLILNLANNTLYYDADGSGRGKAIAIAKLTGITNLDASEDFFVW